MCEGFVIDSLWWFFSNPSLIPFVPGWGRRSKAAAELLWRLAMCVYLLRHPAFCPDQWLLLVCLAEWEGPEGWPALGENDGEGVFGRRLVNKSSASMARGIVVIIFRGGQRTDGCWLLVHRRSLALAPANCFSLVNLLRGAKREMDFFGYLTALWLGRSVDIMLSLTNLFVVILSSAGTRPSVCGARSPSSALRWWNGIYLLGSRLADALWSVYCFLVFRRDLSDCTWWMY